MNESDGPTPLTLAIEAIYSYFKGDQEFTDFMKDLEDFLAVGETGHPDFSGEIARHFDIAAQLAEVMAPAPEARYRHLIEGPAVKIVIDRALRVVAHSAQAHKLFGHLDGYTLTLDRNKNTVVNTGSSASANERTRLFEDSLTGPVLTQALMLFTDEGQEGAGGRRFVRSEKEGGFVSLIRDSELDVVVVTFSGDNWNNSVPVVLNGSLGLSTSEIEVLELMVAGKSNIEIAKERFRSVDTVKSQTQAIFRKLGVTSRVEAVQVVNDLVSLAALSGGPVAEPAPSPGSFPFAHDPASWRLTQRNGRQIGYVHYPVRSGATGARHQVLMFHGLLQSPELTAGARDSLERSGFELLGVSKPGYGSTDHPEPGATFMATSLDDARKVCDDHGFGRGIVLGHLFGAHAAIEYCLRNPERVSALLLCSAYFPIQMADHLVPVGVLQKLAMSSGVASLAAHQFIVRTAVSYLRYGGSHRYLSTLAENSPSDRAAIADPEIYDILRAGIRHVTAGGATAFLSDTASSNSDWSALLSRLQVPTLVLHGSTDPAVDARLAAIAASRIPGAQHQEYPDIGQHLLHAVPERVVSALSDLAVRAG